MAAPIAADRESDFAVPRMTALRQKRPFRLEQDIGLDSPLRES
jgi:hypothetical protein